MADLLLVRCRDRRENFTRHRLYRLHSDRHRPAARSVVSDSEAFAFASIPAWRPYRLVADSTSRFRARVAVC